MWLWGGRNWYLELRFAGRGSYRREHLVPRCWDIRLSSLGGVCSLLCTGNIVVYGYAFWWERIHIFPIILLSIVAALSCIMRM